MTIGETADTIQHTMTILALLVFFVGIGVLGYFIRFILVTIGTMIMCVGIFLTVLLLLSIISYTYK